MIVDGKELLRPFFNNNQKIPKNFTIADRSYYCPKKDIIENEIYPKYRTWLRSIRLLNWSHKWDCDNFADAFKVFSSGYYQQNIDSDAESIAIGVIHYKRSNGNGHAINIAYTEDNNEIKITFIEPQNGQALYLSQAEFDSIFSVYI
jgi:hypothetical protein